MTVSVRVEDLLTEFKDQTSSTLFKAADIKVLEVRFLTQVSLARMNLRMRIWISFI